MVLARPRERSTRKIETKNRLYPLRHFTEHLMGVFRKLPRENDLDHKSSKLSIRWLNSTPEILPAMIHTQHKQNRIDSKHPKLRSKEAVRIAPRRGTPRLEQWKHEAKHEDDWSDGMSSVRARQTKGNGTPDLRLKC
jgi:hypothetical protein